MVKTGKTFSVDVELLAFMEKYANEHYDGDLSAVLNALLRGLKELDENNDDVQMITCEVCGAVFSSKLKVCPACAH